MTDFLLIVLGIALLAGGGEALVRGALAAAGRFGFSALFSGLVIVGFGTSAPELAVSVFAALGGQPDIAVGNVVGSNIANTLPVLGLCALIVPQIVQPLALRRDALSVVAATALFLVFVIDGQIGRLEGLVLFVGLVGYLFWAYRTERADDSLPATMHRDTAGEVPGLPASIPWMLAAIFGGLALLIGGSRVLITGAVDLAAQLGVSEALIGLTLVAVGTSLPELTVTVVAVIRRHGEVAVGNVLGSNLFNLLGILGVSAMARPLPLHPRIVAFDQWVLIATALVMWLFLFTGGRLGRREGAVLLSAYVAYLWASFTLFAG